MKAPVNQEPEGQYLVGFGMKLSQEDGSWLTRGRQYGVAACSKQ